MKPIHTILCAAALAMVGCTAAKKTFSDGPQARVVTPADFVLQPGEQPAAPASSRPQAAAPAQASSSAPAATRTPVAPPPGDDRAYTVDAMVGQVNGRAIYASAVFKDIHEQLVARGKAVPRAAFEREVAGIIAQRLQVIVLESLILGEAERDLTMREQQGLGALLKQQREDMIKRFGRGAAAVADVEIRRQQGRTLDQALEDYRQEVLVKKYLDQHIMPRINVSRRDIERYYQRHYDDFNPPPSRTIHMIRTSDAATADRIDQLLGEGKPFLEIAADASLNSYKAGDKGLFGTDVPGNDVFGPEDLNEATIALAAGQYSPRIERSNGHFWVYVATIKRDPPRPLREVQSEVEGLLRRQQYEQLTSEYHVELFEKGSYDPLEDMAIRLIDVAMARYAAPPPAPRSTRQ
jgi:hypothetical protein